MKKMAIGKISWKDLPPKHHLDSQIAMLFRGAASPQIIADFIREHYFPFAYLYAAELSGAGRGGGAGEGLLDAAADLAAATMENILARAEAGTLDFRGSAAFSSYLYRAVSLGLKASRRIHYPTAVKRLGLPAMNAYRMMLLDGATSGETARYLTVEQGIDPDQARGIIRTIGSFHDDELQRRKKRPGGVSHASLDLLRDGPEGGESGGGYEPAAGTPTPEQQLLNTISLKALGDAVDRLGEPGRSVIRGYMLEGRWQTIAEMEAALELKNGSYELKKAKDELRRLLSP